MASWKTEEVKRHKCARPRCNGKCYVSFCEKCVEELDILERIRIWRHSLFYLTQHRRALSRIVRE